MATNLDEVSAFLEKGLFRYEVHPGRDDIITFFQMDNYEDKRGNKILPIVISLEEEGRFIKIYVPDCYSFKDTRYVKDFFQVLLMISFHTKMLQFECDSQAQTIFAMIEFPLEDASLTEKQLMRALNSLADIIDRYDSAVRLALSTGEIHFNDRQEDRMQELFIQFMNNITSKEEQNEEEQESDEWI